jgi:Uma2 family endonuclease
LQEDGAMATATYVPVETYLRSSYEPDAEYVDGEIEKRPMGEFDHASWQAAIQRWFFLHEDQWQTNVLPELRVQISPTRFRVPDVTVLDFNRPPEQIVTHPPIAVFEVLSPEDTVRRLRRKLDDYAKMGIPQIWVIDPEDSSSFRYQDGHLLRGEVFDEPARGISFRIEEIGKLLRR